jgi:hypothetical protein
MVQNIKEMSSEHTGLPSQFGFWQVDQSISALSVTIPTLQHIKSNFLKLKKRYRHTATYSFWHTYCIRGSTFAFSNNYKLMRENNKSVSQVSMPYEQCSHQDHL